MKTEILDYIGCAYLIYDQKQNFVTGHSKANQYLYNLSFKNSEFQNLKQFLSALKLIELEQRDKAASAILREKAIIDTNDLFCGVVASNNHIIMAQVQKKKSGAFAVLSDVSAEYQYIDRAGAFPRDFIQSQKIEALGNLASGVAHDLNNVFSIIKGYARMMEWDKGITNNTKEKVNSIVEAVDRGSCLTNQILDFGSDKQHKKEVRPLGELLENQKILLRPLLNKNIVLKTNIQENIYAECSPDHIFQILMNLIVNARDSMEGQGEITVSLKKTHNFDLPFILNERDEIEGYSCLSVQDHGCGMTEEVKKRIFDSYYTTKEYGKGTGVGMAVVKSIARDLNAHIDIESTLNEGTNIKIFIPMLRNKSIEEKNYQNLDINLKKKTVLIVENDDELRKLLSSSLADKGMIVLTAADGNEALDIEKQCSGDIDFLVSDIVLPFLNGVDLVKAFKALRPSTKTFMVSGYPANAFPEGINIPNGMSIITKPIDFDDLEDKMLSSIPSITHEEESLSNMAGIA